jgi:hypothetical protein
MIRLRLALIVVALSIVAALPTYGQSCTQGAYPVCGGCQFYYDILYDHDFAETSCGAWYFLNSARASSGSMCASSYPLSPIYTFGKFTGPLSAGSGSISQWVTADQYGDHFLLSYTVEIADSQNSPDTQIRAWIRTPGTYGYYIPVDAPAGGARYCDTRSVDLGHHPEWVNQSLNVEFQALISNSATIGISSPRFWQSTQ